MKMMICAVVAALAVSVPARADITGHFAMSEETQSFTSGSDLSMDFEVRDNGDFRMSLPIPDAYLLARGKNLYIVVTREGEVRAFDFEEAASVMLQDSPNSETEITAGMAEIWSAMELRKTGTVEVGGRSGIAYGLAAKGLEEIPNPSLFVRSSDPDLELLATPLLAIRAGDPGWILFSGMVPMLNLPGAQEIFEHGGPLRIVFLDLVEVDFDPIPEDRFELPGEVAPAEEIRAFVMGAEGPGPK